MSNSYDYSNEQIEKLGNAIRFLTRETGFSKTKVLKLLYLLEEYSIKKFGVPFFNISFQVWKLGPVPQPVYNELSSPPSVFKEYFDIDHTPDGSLINSKGEFDDSEFSENDLFVLKTIYDTYKNSTAQQLVSITHREGSPWYNEAKKQGILDDLLSERLTSSEYTINPHELINSSDLLKKNLFCEYLEMNGDPNRKKINPETCECS
jgi:uncharacterized phage-associated protein